MWGVGGGELFNPHFGFILAPALSSKYGGLSANEVWNGARFFCASPPSDEDK